MSGPGPTPRTPWPCRDCGRLMVGIKTWTAGDADFRRQYPAHQAHDLCNSCYHRWKRGTRGGACQNKLPAAELIEDIEWILGTDTPERIAARVGYPRMKSLTRRLERNGRPDLARIFDRRGMAS